MTRRPCEHRGVINWVFHRDGRGGRRGGGGKVVVSYLLRAFEKGWRGNRIGCARVKGLI